jgi:hypothetical protein
LTFLELTFNQLARLTLPRDLHNLNVLGLGENKFSILALPPGLTKLETLALQDNQLRNLILPSDATNLTEVLLGGNPFRSLALSDPLAATNLATEVQSFRAEGVSVVTFPVVPQLIPPSLVRDGAFGFQIIGPPGVDTVMTSTNLVDWTDAGTITNQFGNAVFSDTAADSSTRKFYRVRQ